MPYELLIDALHCFLSAFSHENLVKNFIPRMNVSIQHTQSRTQFSNEILSKQGYKGRT